MVIDPAKRSWYKPSAKQNQLAAHEVFVTGNLGKCLNQWGLVLSLLGASGGFSACSGDDSRLLSRSLADSPNAAVAPLPTKTRRFVIRGEEYRVEEILGIWAYASAAGNPDVSDQEPVRATLYQFGPLVHHRIDALLKVYRQAGWRFILAGRTPPPNARLLKIFSRNDGDLIVDSYGQLLVQLQGDMSEVAANQLLAPVGFDVSYQFRFAPSLFVIEPIGDQTMDLIDRANQLNVRPDFIFAEPSFIQYIGGRSGVSVGN